jgi:hypothetical protein
MTNKQLTKYQITNQINRVLGYDFLLCDSMYSKSELFEMYNEIVITGKIPVWSEVDNSDVMFIYPMGCHKRN